MTPSQAEAAAVVITQALRRSADALQERAAARPDDLVSAARIVHQARAVHILGTGKSHLVGERAAATFRSMSLQAAAIHATEVVHGDLATIKPGDAILALSYSGETRETVRACRAIRVAHGNAVHIITVTSRVVSTLGLMSDQAVVILMRYEASQRYPAPTVSMVQMAAILDAIGIAAAEARGHTLGEYLRNHPGGPIGNLRYTVAELMSEDCPAITGSRLIREVLAEMTRAKTGAAAVVDDGGRPVGIFTDGDLRRLLLGGQADMDASVGSVMRGAPATVHPGQLALDAIKVMHERQCDNLLVVDEDGHLVGILDERDIMLDRGVQEA